jgi:hypothetical protein
MMAVEHQYRLSPEFAGLQFDRQIFSAVILVSDLSRQAIGIGSGVQLFLRILGLSFFAFLCG